MINSSSCIELNTECIKEDDSLSSMPQVSVKITRSAEKIHNKFGYNSITILTAEEDVCSGYL